MIYYIYIYIYIYIQKIVPQRSVSLALKLMRGLLVSKMITDMQSKMGTDEFDAAAHDALFSQQAKFYKNEAKASAHESTLGSALVLKFADLTA